MSGLTRWQPYREFPSLQERINQLLADAFPVPEFDLFDSASSMTSWFTPRTDLYEEKDKFALDMEIPGAHAEDLKLYLEGNTLTISGERKFEGAKKNGNYHKVERSYGNFSRAFTLPSTVDPNTVKAKYESGVLHVTITKKPESGVQQIKIAGESKPLTAKAA